MNEHPVVLGAEEVRNTLEGRQTKILRPLKLPEFVDPEHWVRCPYGEPGDRLWVRETWAPHADEEQTFENYRNRLCGVGPCALEDGGVRPEIFYRADGGDPFINNWRPSIHMPRWASRLTLVVQDLEIIQLQSITDADAVYLGAKFFKDIPCTNPIFRGGRWSTGNPLTTDHGLGSARFAVANQWNRTAKEGQSWPYNPWVWLISFSILKR